MKKPPQTMQQLKTTQKRRIAEWLYAAILKSMAETGAKPDEAAMLQLATGVTKAEETTGMHVSACVGLSGLAFVTHLHRGA